jgi:hypothetical protein
MKVFISWSGRRSHEVAKALDGWLKKVIQSAEPWVSSDMERGVKWLVEVGESLDAHSIGILCVTSGNFSAPWLNFEAGALSKQFGDDGRVIPYLLDFRSAGELEPPLGQFNASLADEPGTYDLVKTLNAHSESKLSETDLDETFKMWWPSLRDKLEAIRASGSGHPPKRRTTDDKIDELLDLTRQLMRQVPAVLTKDEFSPLSTSVRNLAAHGDVDPSKVQLVTRDELSRLRREDHLDIGERARRGIPEEMTAVVTIAAILRKAGVDENALHLLKNRRSGRVDLRVAAPQRLAAARGSRSAP